MSSTEPVMLAPARVMGQLAAEAFEAGKTAAAGRGKRINPFRGDSEHAAERVQARMWARGFSAGNPFADLDL